MEAERSNPRMLQGVRGFFFCSAKAFLSSKPPAAMAEAQEFLSIALTSTSRRQRTAPGLRFDKVATRVVDCLQAAVGDSVPRGMTVLVTITAPIRLPAKTVAGLEESVRTLLKRTSLRRDVTGTIHGNRIRIRLLKDQPARAPKLIGFVHNPNSDSRLLLDMWRTFS